MTASDVLVAGERAEVRARRDMVRALPAPVAAALGIGCAERDGAVASWCTALDVPPLDRLVGLGVDAPATEARLDALVDAARRAGARRSIVQVVPVPGTAALPDWLAARGAAPIDARLRLLHTLASLPPLAPPAGLRVETVGPDEAGDCAAAIVEVFGLPPALAPWFASCVGRPGWSMFVARDGAQIVATGALHVAQGAAWLGMGTTRPAWRGRGAQSALIATRLRAAVDAGCTLAAAEVTAGGASHRNARRLGFADGGVLANWRVPLDR